MSVKATKWRVLKNPANPADYEEHPTLQLARQARDANYQGADIVRVAIHSTVSPVVNDDGTTTWEDAEAEVIEAVEV